MVEKVFSHIPGYPEGSWFASRIDLSKDTLPLLQGSVLTRFPNMMTVFPSSRSIFSLFPLLVVISRQQVAIRKGNPSFLVDAVELALPLGDRKLPLKSVENLSNEQNDPEDQYYIEEKLWPQNPGWRLPRIEQNMNLTRQWRIITTLILYNEGKRPAERQSDKFLSI
jgi:hypothetical protein